MTLIPSGRVFHRYVSIVHLQVLRSEVALRRKQHLNILRGGVEDRGEVCRARHDCGLDNVKF